MDARKAAEMALADEQERYKSRRAADANRARRQLPYAQTLADEIRHIFLSAVENVLSHSDEASFQNAMELSLDKQNKLKNLLIENGFEPDTLFDTHMCKTCSDTGYTGAEPCECLRRHMVKLQTMRLSALGGRTFDSFNLNVFSRAIDQSWGRSQFENMEGNLVYCRHWVKTFGEQTPNLFLNGGTGQGKTFLCGCIANAAAGKGIDVKYVTAISMFADLENKRFDRGEADVRPYYNSELLIIDDLGTEMTTAFVQSALYDVINSRLTTGRKMIINANFTAHELSQVYMPQICSRLLGEFKQLHFFGPDLRLG